MKVAFISDTHGTHKYIPNLPEADVICHTGDLSGHGYTEEIIDFMKWFATLPYKHKVFIAGNHDWGWFHHEDVLLNYVPEGITYLRDSSVIIDGLKFYGTPWQPVFLDWAFNLEEGELVKKWELIPSGTDILLTHCPPHNILDLANYRNEHTGSKSLLDKILEIDPIVSAFGHIHEAYGSISLYNNITFVNSSLLNRRYELVNDPIVINVVR